MLLPEQSWMVGARGHVGETNFPNLEMRKLRQRKSWRLTHGHTDPGLSVLLTVFSTFDSFEKKKKII